MLLALSATVRLARPLPAVAATEPIPAATSTPEVGDAELREWIEAMKRSPRGPFEAIRWFCADGAVLPPRAGACSERGGGRQHGLLSERARVLRARGFAIGQVLASLEPASFVGEAADLDALRQLVLERFLVRWDDGWIFRRARTYRGALQAEDEEAASERLMLALLEDSHWLAPSRFLLLRELARVLPLPRQRDVAARMRTLAAELGDADEGFAPLRARIHAFPDPADAVRVRDYAAARPDRERYEDLAKAIDAFFASETAAVVSRLLPELRGRVADVLRAELEGLRASEPRERLAASARALESIRRDLVEAGGARARLAALRASLALEQEAFAAGQSILAAHDRALDRGESLRLLTPLANALYGVGFVSGLQLDAVRSSIEALVALDAPTLGTWRAELGYLARLPEWSRRWLLFQMEPAIVRLARIEPEATLYEPDRLRGSPLLVYSALLDALLRDAKRLAGAADRVLGEDVGVGLRGLSPGIATGVLRRATTPEEVAALPSDSVALLPETTAHLPPVAAILTLGEGSSLSHVQLLARNLGIPNAVVSPALAERLTTELGRRLEVVVSRAGRVLIERAPTAPALGTGAALPDGPPERVIRVDETRLDLARTDPIPLDALSSADSGGSCGPKAANLGELRRHFGEAVPDGFVIPFGVFRALLDRPIEPGGPAAFVWLQTRYRALDGLAESERPEATAALLARMRSWLAAQEPDPALREALAERLAALGQGGVFVRSDTNVEDLPGFSGAGLNLTLANVVGVEAVLEAVRRVWASPFGDRAYAWRQAHMARPELVFPSILVQRAFPAEVSGVLVTVDVDTGDPGVLTVAVGEGVGGAVDGQAAESLRIDREGGEVRQLAAATAPFATELAPEGGVRRRPASGVDTLLGSSEVEQLIELSTRIGSLPGWRDPGAALPAADVEFAFRDGHLAVLQLRPLAESRRGALDERLRRVDEPARRRSAQRVPLDEPPGREAS